MRHAASRRLALALPLLAACAPPRLGTQAKIARVDAALGGTAGSGSKYLRYAAESDAGAWTREIVVTPSAYAERRTRSDGTTYAFGRDAIGGWLRVSDGAVIDASGSMWEQEASTGAGLFGLRFAQPAADDEATYMGRSRAAWELAYRPEGGRTLTFAIDRRPGAGGAGAGAGGADHGLGDPEGRAEEARADAAGARAVSGRRLLPAAPPR